MKNQQPPCNIEAEQEVLGSMMERDEAVPIARKILNPSDFFRPEHQDVYLAICTIADAGASPTMLAVVKNLEERGDIRRCGGREYFRDKLIPVAASNCEYHAREIKKASVRRAMIRLGLQVTEAGWNPTADPEQALLQYQQTIEALGNSLNHRDLHLTTCMADIEPIPIQWLHPTRIALGKLTVFAGNPGLGKSFVTLDYAARVSRGDGWPDYPTNYSKPGGVILLGAEDGKADTVRPRLDAAGADCSRIRTLNVAKFNLQDHMPLLEKAIDEVQDPRLVIIDPISAYLGETDSHNNAEVRAVLAPLADMAERHNVAVIALSHLNKSGGEAISRIMGSLAFVAAARAVYAIVKDKDDPTRRLFLPVKNNIGVDTHGLAYRLFSQNETMPAVAWEANTISVTADDMVSHETPRHGPEPIQRMASEKWLRELLAPGPMHVADIEEQAKAAGMSMWTTRKAADELDIERIHEGFGPGSKWLWKLKKGT